MRKIKQLKQWGIYELNQKEKTEHNFNFAVIHPDNMECSLLTPSDTDMEMDSIENAISWIKNY